MSVIPPPRNLFDGDRVLLGRVIETKYFNFKLLGQND